MKKFLFVIARYNDERQELFEKYISPKNKDYCFRHNLEYFLLDHSIPVFNPRINPTWLKFSIIDQFVKDGTVEEGDRVVHFDADMVVVKPEFEYASEKSFSYAIDSCNSHCMGNFCLNINEWSVGLLNNLLDEEFYQKNREVRHWQYFREQAAWYSLAGITPEPSKSFFKMPNRGFNSFLDDNTKYNVKELKENVEIKDPIWNVTLLNNEIDNRAAKSLTRYHVNKTMPENTIIRHFAGHQPWRREYLK